MLTEQPNNLESLKERFALWRASKLKGEKIPEFLWQMVLDLTSHYKWSVLIGTLGISSAQFKKKFPHLFLQDAVKEAKNVAPSKRASPFVEVPLPKSTAQPVIALEQPTMVIEYTTGIKISLFSIPPEQWLSLCQAWRNG